ncbi:hypothetical protein [Shimia haliotis]|uniref:DUF4189 domain-containing protein n=1 Tax=Shimia haliotis TaxID=1280847 RepID=A0A1I4CVG9_9RHOB|nr:hypothetical protein [Shimia haliotis]SFK83911.1 hypothetical protein SAMN04488036_102464 [Shimia haliotis]
MIDRIMPLLKTCLICTVALSAGVGHAQGINVEKKKSRLHELSSVKLRGNAKSSFKTFKRKADFYGVFYANPAENTAGYYYNASSLDVADGYARAACEANSRSPFGCVLYARVLPKKHDASATGITLSRQGNKDFREYQRLQDPERYGAFAQSANGASGFSWAEHSRDAAESEALRRCQKAARKLWRKMPKEMRTAATDPSKQACQIVHRSG